MEPSDTLLLRIEKYLSGRLSDEEKVVFEKEMEEDPELGNLVWEQQATETFLDAGLEEIRREQMLEWGKQLSGRSRNRWGMTVTQRRVFMLSAAAILLVLLIIFIPDFFSPKGLTDSERASDLFAQTPLGQIYLDGGDSLKLSLMLFLQKEQYAEGAAWVENQLTDSTLKGGQIANLYLYKGYFFFQQEKWAEAVEAFSAISPKQVAHQEAEWRLALTYLKMGETDKAMAKLREIQKVSDHPFSRKATTLLLDLERKN